MQNSYGGPGGPEAPGRRLPPRGLAVVLDVVYNHLGPEGNYLGDFGPYFTDRYRTPWGAALNFDGPDSDEVRRYFIENALCWVAEFHIDALRLDAVHGIVDFSAAPFLAELAEAVQRRAGSAARTGRMPDRRERPERRARRHARGRAGGFGLDAQWSDDFHHALHTLLTGERDGYYADFGERRATWRRRCADGLRLRRAQYSRYRRRRHGNRVRGTCPRGRFVVFAQNHDQVGNRMRGDRLAALVSFEALKLAAGAVLLSPFVPLLFMGEEYGETAPVPLLRAATATRR